MDNKQFIIEILKYSAWPAVIIVSVFILKDKITNLFSGGIKSVKHGDTEVQFLEGQKSARPENTRTQNLHNLIPVDPTGLREEQEQKINSELALVSEDNEKIDILVKNLAQQQISNTFEKVYFNIFGSQIRLLEFLSVQPGGKSDTESLSVFFEDSKSKNPDALKSIQFSDYMNYLITWELVKNSETEWLITKHGRGFITYITAMQLNKNKAL